MTGGHKDSLVIWVKMDDGTGNIRRMKKIQTFYGIYLVLIEYKYFPAATLKLELNVWIYCVFNFKI